MFSLFRDMVKYVFLVLELSSVAGVEALGKRYVRTPRS